MKQKTRRAISILVLIFSIISIYGCSAQGEPGLEAAESYLQRDLSDLQNMVEWLQSTEYESVAFWRSEDSMLAGIEKNPIDDTIRPTLERLYKKGYQFISMKREANTIEFEYWWNVHDQGCGLAYVMEGDDKPDVQFMIDCERLSVKGWYYYYSDYNEWRSNH